MPIKNSPKCGANLLSPLSSLLFPFSSYSFLSIPAQPPSLFLPSLSSLSLLPLSLHGISPPSLSPPFSLLPHEISPKFLSPPSLSPPFSLLPHENSPKSHPNRPTDASLSSSPPHRSKASPTSSYGCPLPTWTTHLPSLSPIRLFLPFHIPSLKKKETARISPLTELPLSHCFPLTSRLLLSLSSQPASLSHSNSPQQPAYFSLFPHSTAASPLSLTFSLTANPSLPHSLSFFLSQNSLTANSLSLSQPTHLSLTLSHFLSHKTEPHSLSLLSSRKARLKGIFFGSNFVKYLCTAW